ncbi:uncharacterized protein LOC124257729 [Haliotis rubra]|uniref:uncharacterized protein LOC124257729 n=1 Tax=Haliotis rubra TaxID=36100 RepID=UPI001EE5E2DD|nr:uncharacterized protein LOC124257729 [Haliotis rubra]
MWTTLCLVAGLLLCVEAATHLPTTATTIRPTPTPLSLRNLFRIVFRREDFNGDGVHSLLEFEHLWSLSDMDGDGSVTVTEYTYSDQFGKFTGTELYKYFDHDHNGVIHLQELPRIFTEYDTNFDGWITEQEFVDENIRIYKFITNDVGTDNSYFGHQ